MKQSIRFYLFHLYVCYYVLDDLTNKVLYDRYLALSDMAHVDLSKKWSLV